MIFRCLDTRGVRRILLRKWHSRAVCVSDKGQRARARRIQRGAEGAFQDSSARGSETAHGTSCQGSPCGIAGYLRVWHNDASAVWSTALHRPPLHSFPSFPFSSLLSFFRLSSKQGQNNADRAYLLPARPSLYARQIPPASNKSQAHKYPFDQTANRSNSQDGY